MASPGMRPATFRTHSIQDVLLTDVHHGRIRLHLNWFYLSPRPEDLSNTVIQCPPYFCSLSYKDTTAYRTQRHIGHNPIWHTGVYAVVSAFYLDPFEFTSGHSVCDYEGFDRLGSAFIGTCSIARSSKHCVALHSCHFC